MLTLPIKSKWYDMILRGEKLEEYREIKPYYASRFDKFMNQNITIKLRNGYSADSRALIANVHVCKGFGVKEWGADPDKQYYVLKINEVVSKGL